MFTNSDDGLLIGVLAHHPSLAAAGQDSSGLAWTLSPLNGLIELSLPAQGLLPTGPTSAEEVHDGCPVSSYVEVDHGLIELLPRLGRDEDGIDADSHEQPIHHGSRSPLVSVEVELIVRRKEEVRACAFKGMLNSI